MYQPGSIHSMRLIIKVFLRLRKIFLEKINTKEISFKICFYSVYDRLGQYLLINSDGDAWLPNEYGKSIQLGKIYDNEETILKNWNISIRQLKVPELERQSMLGN